MSWNILALLNFKMKFIWRSCRLILLKIEDYGIVILKVEEVDNEEQFVTVDDEDTLDQVYQSFMEQLFDDYND